MQILILILLISLSFPCSCMEPPPPEDAYEDADTVFAGEVSNIVLDDSGNYYEVTFQIIDVWKGEDLDLIPQEITILTETSSDICGYNFQINHEYLVYAYNYNGGIYTNICTRTNLLEYALEDLDFLNELNICETGFTEINSLCFHEGDLSVIQKMIDNSYASDIELGCSEWDNYCGSPNPYMDSVDSWFWVTVDSVYYEWTGNNNGMVEPLELGIQEWENGRLTSLMCGAYIYCQLSGPIPEEIELLTEIEVFRLEYNYLSGFIPEAICDLNTEHSDYLDFDLSGNLLCPPYPDCISTDGFWSQDISSCSELGDINFDGIINILDIIVLLSFILEQNQPDYQELVACDINLDGSVNVLDVVEIIDIILNI